VLMHRALKHSAAAALIEIKSARHRIEPTHRAASSRRG
jgi:hypothetical protein